jgi:hypothetical protein
MKANFEGCSVGLLCRSGKLKKTAGRGGFSGIACCWTDSVSDVK